MAKSIKVEGVENRIITVGGKRFYLPYPHPMPSVGGEVNDELLIAVSPKKEANKPKEVSIGKN